MLTFWEDDIHYNIDKIENIILRSCHLEQKVFSDNCIIKELDENICLASRNIGNIKVVLPEEVNTYDVVNADKMLLTESSLQKLEEVISGE